MSSSPPDIRSSFSIDDFNQLLSTALDFDPPPLLPLPSFPSPYAHDILALDLNLHNMSLLDLQPSSPPSSFFHKVRSRASALIRRSTKHEPPRPKPQPLSFLNLQSSSTHGPDRRPSRSSLSLRDAYDNRFSFSQPAITPPETPPRPLPGLPIRRSKSYYSSVVKSKLFGDVPLPPPPSSPRLYDRAPLPTPPLSSFSSPSLNYLNTRRGSGASANSLSSSILQPPSSLRSTASTLTSRLSSSLSFPRLPSNPFSRSKSRLGLTLDIDVAKSPSTPSTSTTCYSPLTPQTPSHFPTQLGARNSKTVLSSHDLSDRILTPEPDPFARVDSYCANHSDGDDDGSDFRSKTPTMHRPTGTEKPLATPPIPASSHPSPMISPKKAAAASDHPLLSISPSQSKYHLKPRPRTHTTNSGGRPDWTLCLPPSHSVPRSSKKQLSNPVINRTHVKASSTPARPGSPFPFTRGRNTGTITVPKSNTKFFLEEPDRSESDSRRSSFELQSDIEWPLPPKRTVVVVVGSDTEGEREAGKKFTSPERGRSVQRGWHEVEQSVEYFSPKTAPHGHGRRHSVRFPRRSRTFDPNCFPPESAPSGVTTFSSKGFNPDEKPLPSTASQSLDDHQLKAIIKTFRAALEGSDQFPADSNMRQILDSESRASLESTASRPVKRTRSKTMDSQTSSASSRSFYTAKSRLSVASRKAIVENADSSVSYTWKGVEVANSRGHWNFWLLALDGFLDGQENGAVKILARSWSELMEFCMAHQRVIIGRSVCAPSADDPVVLRVVLVDCEQETVADGIEMTLALQRSSCAPEDKADARTLLAFQLPTPTTFSEVARYCKMGTVGQGVRHGA